MANVTQADWMTSSLWGVSRGLCVHTMIFPLDVLKIRLQSASQAEPTVRIALNVLKDEGPGAFYKGLPPQLLKTSIKQVWCWPIITQLPPYLGRYGMGRTWEQMLTGLAISTIDATINTPLERAKILSASTGKNSYSLKGIYENGWRGFATHWTKLSVSWVSFLTAQRVLRDRIQGQSDQPLSLPQLTKVGLQVAFIVSLATAPFDMANTLKQTHNLNPITLLSQKNLPKLYRGWPLQALALSIHNIASVIVIDKLTKKHSLN